jgi:hypothetical protein
MSITFKKVSEEWEVSNEYGHKVSLSVEYKRGKADITPPSGGHFSFLTSDPDKASKIGELIVAAAEHGKRIISLENEKKEIQ